MTTILSLDKLHGVLCLWEWKQRIIRPANTNWQLVNSYPIDDDGYQLTPVPQPPKKNLDEEFAYSRSGDDLTPIAGRCVTLWTFTNGVSLQIFHPTGCPAWLNVEFGERLRTIPDWFNYVQDGHVLIRCTIAAARKLIATL